MKMNYVVVGTNDMAAAAAFYDALFKGLELNRTVASDRMTYWIGADFAFAVALPYDKVPASVGNGMMVGFSVGSSAEVERRHALALSLGAEDEGAPGQRGPKFSCYFRDLDGNKLCLSD